MIQLSRRTVSTEHRPEFRGARFDTLAGSQCHLAVVSVINRATASYFSSVLVYKHTAARGFLGLAPPRKLFKIRCSDF